ncbi:phage tail fiber protein [Pectobacterium cacticida]|uniref:phage tail fiber protein n=1 Tax=Pectobacterium cacticida TaxID=69221 RepID=UPI003986A9BB
MTVGAFGLGGNGQAISEEGDAAIAWYRGNVSQIYRNNAISNRDKQYSASLLMKTGDTWSAWSAHYGDLGVSVTAGGASGDVVTYDLLHSRNTTVDANGFIKTASPILRIANSANMPDNWLEGFTVAGCGAVNGEATGVAANRLDVGVYLVSGSLGLAESGWTIEIPQDVNGNRLCFVETETAENGDITVRVSTRRFDIETGNVVAGEPIDIPAGRWIDLRLSMPAVTEPDYSVVDSDSSEVVGSDSSKTGI